MIERAKNFLKDTYPLISSIFLFISAVFFENPFIECNFSEVKIKIINTMGLLLSEGLCFSFLFFYFIEFLPSIKAKNKAKIILSYKIQKLILTIPFKPLD
jgi:hypothetical protein